MRSIFVAVIVKKFIFGVVPFKVIDTFLLLWETDNHCVVIEASGA